MLHFDFILASDDDSMTFKLIFWAIVIVIWAISSVVSALKKKMRQFQEQQATGEVPIDLTPRMEIAPAPMQAAPRPPMLRPGARVIVTPAPQMQVAGAPRQRKVKRATPPPLVPRVPAPVAVRKAEEEPSVEAIPVPRAWQVAQALRPEALRNQVLLAEVLGKPLALREP